MDIGSVVVAGLCMVSFVVLFIGLGSFVGGVKYLPVRYRLR